MRKFIYENQGSETLLVYPLAAGEHIDSFAKGMLQSNEIPGVLKPSFMQRNQDQYLKYNITSKIPLREYIQSTMNREKLTNIFLSIATAFDEAEEYMLGQERFLLDPEYLFVDVSEKKAYLVNLPVDEFSQETEAGEFFLNLLIHARYDMEEDVSYVAKMIHFLNQPKTPDWKEMIRFFRLLQQDDPEKERSPLVRPEPQRPELGLHPDPEARRAEAFSRGPAEKSEASRPGPCMEAENRPEPEASAAGPEQKGQGRRLFVRKEKKTKEPKTAKQKNKNSGQIALNIPIPGVEAPAGPAAEITLDVDAETGKIIPPEPEPAPEAKKGRFFFRKKEKKQQVFSATLPVAPGFGSQPPAGGAPFPDERPQQQERSEREIYHQAREGSTVYVGRGNSDDANKTVIIGGGRDYAPTVLLGSGTATQSGEANITARLTRRRNGQSMAINKEVFHIGKESSFVDFYVGDNLAVGAVHADIFLDKGQYYISDRNSVNHTYVNGEMVRAGEQKLLADGDRITLADEEFDFSVH